VSEALVLDAATEGEAQTAADWTAANQRYLMAVLARLRRALQAHAERGGTAPVPPAGDAAGAAEGAPDEAPEAIAAGMADPPALVQLCAAFGLSPFERDLLTLCAGVELDAAVAPLCAQAQGDPQRPYPTFSLALAALPGAHWSAVTPGAPLRHWQLIEVLAGSLPAGSPLTRSPLRVDERVLHFLAGTPSLDERLAGTVEAVPPPESLAPSHRALAERLAGGWTRAPEGAPPPAVDLWGASREARQAVAGAACALAGLRLYAIGAETLPAAPGEQESLCRLWAREAALGGAALLVECELLDSADAARLGAAGRFVRQVLGPLLVSSGEPLPALGGKRRRLEVPRPAPAEQHALWRRALGPLAQTLNGRLTEVVMQFDLGLPEIDAAGLEVLEDAQAESARATDAAGQEAEGTDLGHRLWDACRAQARPRLDDLAQRLEPRAAWEDLVLPEPQRRVLLEIAVHVRQRATVYERWGFGARGARGLGIAALFAGPSGTGKTLAAEVLAAALRLDLYRIDLSAVVSKYVGETEKNLRRVFGAAEAGGAVLLFDEADALFGKRAEVKDAHDRYANVETGYLLQRMEAYRGLAVLTTNTKSALDPAFLRRLRFVVQFPFPDAAQREQIWRRAFPPQTPTAGLDAALLSRLSVAGGNIRNIALGAAFLAADAGEPVQMSHLLQAARGEYAKLERSLTDAETLGWR
jgi:hypothetical protein